MSVEVSRIMQQIDVARNGSLKAGYSTQGIVREKAFESENVIVSRTRIAGGAISAWHHHAARHLYGFLVSGRMRLEFGSRGELSVEVEPGDFFHIPPGLVHRDVNPSEKEEAVVANILVGKGDPVVNVRGPELA